MSLFRRPTQRVEHYRAPSAREISPAAGNPQPVVFPTRDPTPSKSAARVLREAEVPRARLAAQAAAIARQQQADAVQACVTALREANAALRAAGERGAGHTELGRLDTARRHAELALQAARARLEVLKREEVEARAREIETQDAVRRIIQWEQQQRERRERLVVELRAAIKGQKDAEFHAAAYAEKADGIRFVIAELDDALKPAPPRTGA